MQTEVPLKYCRCAGIDLADHLRSMARAGTTQLDTTDASEESDSAQGFPVISSHRGNNTKP